MIIIGHEEKHKLEKFKAHWLEICNKFEINGVSKQDSKNWKIRYGRDRDLLHHELQNVIGSLNSAPNSYTKKNIKIVLDIMSEMPRFNDTFNISLQIGVNKYRERERLQLKEHYGFFGDLVYIFRKLTGGF